MKAQILILEDDCVLLETLAEELGERYEVTTARDGREFLDLTFHHHYDLYLLDINVPYIDGLTLLDELRVSGNETAAIFLSANRMERERMEGFRAGADDYLCKPFSIGELKLRVEALLRRTHHSNTLILDDVLIDLENNRLKIDGQEHQIERKELAMLHFFLSHSGEILSVDRIIEALYYDKTPSATVIRVHISQINALFSQKRIHNVRGVGYRYDRP